MKKVLGILLSTVLVFVSIKTVSAAEYVNLSNVVDKFNALNLKISFEDCDSEDGKVTAKYNNSDSKSITFSCKKSEEALITLTEDDDSHTLSFTETEYTAEKLEQAIPDNQPYVDKYGTYVSAKFTIMDNFLEIFLSESGYTDIDLPYNFDETSDFLLKSEGFISRIPEDLPSREGKVFFEPIDVTSLKLSLDKDKIKAFVEKVGDKYIRKLMDVIPALELNSVTSTSVNLNPKIDFTTEEGYKAECYLYRSDTKDFNNDFNNLIRVLDNCLPGTIITDDGLNANTTYYYKIQLKGSNKVSESLEVTTSSNIVNPSPTPNDEKENPNTGIFAPIGLLSLLAVGGVAALVYTKKRNKFKNY